MTSRSSLVGKKGEAEIVSVFTARTNTDLNAGQGEKVDKTFHSTERGAILGAVGIGVMGADGEVGKRLAVRFSDGTLVLLVASDDPTISLTDETLLEAKIRTKALAKLSDAERRALGVT